MIGERKEERRAFTKEERMQILKNTGGICACCGKKLTETNMTVEHIIPLSRGGTNDMENLTALCELHNKLKDNLLYMPFGFYAAIRNKPSFFKMEEHVRNWFKSIADEFDLERFPLISPQFIIQIDPIGKIGSWKKIKFNPQMTLKWEIVGRKAYKGVEAETGINIENIRMNMNLLMKGNPDSKAHPVPLYCLKKVNSKKNFSRYCRKLLESRWRPLFLYSLALHVKNKRQVCSIQFPPEHCRFPYGNCRAGNPVLYNMLRI